MEPKALEILMEVEKRMGRFELLLERNTDSLEEHIKRTEMLEERVQPLENHIAMWAGAGKTIAYIGTVLSALGGLTALILKFGH